MKAICIPTYNRQAELNKTVASLEKCLGMEGWTIYANADGPSKLITTASYDWVQNGSRLGCDLNTFMVISRAIEYGARAIIYSDDDILFSPDALQMCDWYLSLNHDPDDIGIALCRRFDNDPNNPLEIVANDVRNGLMGQGWCFTRKQWFDYILRYFWFWEDEMGGPERDVWDWRLGHMAQKLGKKLMRPKLARSQHAGAVGWHGTGNGVFPEVIASEIPKEPYRIVK